MSWSGGAMAAARALNAAFCLAVAVMCFLALGPFAYEQLIKPKHIPALTDFIQLWPWLFAVTLLITILTLMPQLRDRSRRWIAGTYVTAAAIAAVAVFAIRPLDAIGNNATTLAIALGALAIPIALSWIDHRTTSSPDVHSVDDDRLLTACVAAGAIVWCSYAIVARVRLAQVIGIELSTRGFAAGAAAAFAVHLFAFMLLYVVLTMVCRMARLRSRAVMQYRSCLALLAIGIALVLYRLVSEAIALRGAMAVVACVGLGASGAAAWADVARLRSGSTARAIDALSLFAAPIAGSRSRRVATAVTFALPVIAYAFVAMVLRRDWDFLLQKLGVLVVWLIAFCASYVAVEGRPRLRGRAAAIAYVTVAAVLYFATGAVAASHAATLDRYAAVDASFRLVWDVRIERSAETREFYAFLRANTLQGGPMRPVEIDSVRPLRTTSERRPDIYLFVVDSMRRDYLGPYNPKAKFAPAIANLAADGFAFERAFTRYAGTALAVPSIWAGGLVVHRLDQPWFDRRDTLLKLLDANQYLRLMSMDIFVDEMIRGDENLIRLDRGRKTGEYDLCTTLDELSEQLSGRDRSRPIFFYSLPQNVHIADATRRKVPPGESYPGFFAPVASSLHRVDGCFGTFVDFLKRTNRYDNSIIIVTSDHGDLLGEEDVWGHFSLVPEVMRIPLIVKLPASLRARVDADVSAVSFATDIAPTLYGLLGYEPADLGTLFGRPLFVPRGRPLPSRRSDAFLLASSYGPVYGMLRQNGERLFVVDALDAKDEAFEMFAIGSRRLDLTPSATKETRDAIAQQLHAIADRYR